MTATAPLPSLIHHPRRHAAVRTSEYVFSQLIPYIGNKRKLLHLIGAALDGIGGDRPTFVDLFTGSTVVARFAKKRGCRVIANDWEPYAFEIARGTVALNRPPPFARLGGPAAAFRRLAALRPVHGYVATHLCPADDERPDPDRERMFFTRANGEKIDAIREQIARWQADRVISPAERSWLLAPLLYAVSYASNTSGVFKGFHRGWGGKTATALYRIRAPLALSPPVLFDNRRANRALCADAQTLAADLRHAVGETPDVVYIDPPYNQHPYGSNYHVLTTVALWDKPPLSPTIAPQRGDKSAIRTDWRRLRRSPYNSAGDATTAFEQLINAIDAPWLLVSYSTDGNIPLPDLLRILAARGDVQVVPQRYKRYRVSTPRMSPRSHNVEFVATVNTRRRPCPSRVSELADTILAVRDGQTSA